MSEPRFIEVFVEANPCLPDGCSQRWKAEDEPRPVARVRLDGRELRVVGWSSAGATTARAVTVEDSAGGAAILIVGGDWGLRLEPLDGSDASYAPYLLLGPAALLA
jgi:hypothetical protein